MNDLKIGTEIKLIKARWGYPKYKKLTIGGINPYNSNDYRLDSKKSFVWVKKSDLIKYTEVQ